jgi:hypothetical protein
MKFRLNKKNLYVRRGGLDFFLVVMHFSSLKIITHNL